MEGSHSIRSMLRYLRQVSAGIRGPNRHTEILCVLCYIPAQTGARDSSDYGHKPSKKTDRNCVSQHKISKKRSNRLMSNSKITAYVLRDLCGDACLNKGSEACLIEIQQWLKENELNQDLLRKSAGYKDNYRYTPLHYLVCAHPALDLVKKLIQLAPEAVKVKNISGCLPLHLCCGYAASTEVIKLILEAYPEAAQMADNNGRLPLHIACKSDASPEVKKMLLQAYPKASEVQDKDGELVLHLLCRSNSPSSDVIRMVIEANPKATEVQDNYGMLPLHWTCYNMAPIDIERILVGAFPDGISKRDNTGKLPLDHVRGRGDVSKELLSLLSHQKSNYRRGSIAGSLAAFMPQFPKNWLFRCVQAKDT